MPEPAPPGPADITVAPRRVPGRWWPEAFAPADVALIRRELIDYHSSVDGIRTQAAMCAAGRQALLPAVSGPEAQARVLCAAEVARLRAARLFYVNAETVELIGAAYDSYPSVPSLAHDPPGECGFVVFGAPLLCRPIDADEYATQRAVGEAMPHLSGAVSAGDPVYVVAAAWGPFTPPAWRGTPGIWVSFYASRSQITRFWTAEQRASEIARMPPVTPENEAAWQTLPEVLPPGKTERDYTLPDDRGGTAGWGRLLTCVWHLMRQGHLVQSEAQRVPRAERRRHERQGLGDPGDVVVVSYRRAVREEAESAGAALAAGAAGRGSHYSVRFPVSPHWRNQWYPRSGEHRPKYIPAHWKGPADGPVLIRDRVNVF